MSRKNKEKDLLALQNERDARQLADVCIYARARMCVLIEKMTDSMMTFLAE